MQSAIRLVHSDKSGGNSKGGKGCILRGFAVSEAIDVIVYVLNVNGCAGQTIRQTTGLASGSSFPVGATNNTFQDATGANCSFNVVVRDTEKPAITCPANLALCYSSDGTYTIPALIATDNCGIKSISFNP